MTTKILIDAPSLMKIIDGAPEVELEILRSAIPQVAQLIRKREALDRENLEKRIETAYAKVVSGDTSRWGVPAKVGEFIQDRVASELSGTMRETVTKAASKAIDELVTKAITAAEVKLSEKIAVREDRARQAVEQYAKEVAEREVLALLRAGNLVVKP